MSKPKGVMHAVTVTATEDAAGHLEFHPDSRVWDSQKRHFAFNKKDHHMRDDDYHIVEFLLDDRTANRLRFPPEPHEAMWVAKVNDPDHPKCPDASTVSDYEVIDPLCVCDDGRRLIVRNDNPREEDWSFTLNFIKPGAEKAGQASWDPIIKNGGNGKA